MPEFIHNFTRGKMESDLDERMVPNGSYRDALNVTVATSEASNVGALQNLKGNTERKGKPNSNSDWSTSYISDLVNPTCIGSIRNEPTECIYWFIVSEASSNTPAVNAIAEFNQKTGKVSPVLVDTKGILNFSKDQKHLITGVNIVDDLLYFTDNLNEPKKINITKFKLGSINFLTHTKIAPYNTSTTQYSSPSANALDFAEEDITVIKKSPLYALTADVSTSTRSAAGQEVPGTGVTPLSCTYDFTGNFPQSGDKWFNFTYINDAATSFLPAKYRPLPTYAEWLADTELSTGRKFAFLDSFNGMIEINVGVNVSETYSQGDNIVLNGSVVGDYNNTDEYQIRLEVDSVNTSVITAKIMSIPSEILRFGTSLEELITWEVLLQEKDPMFEFEFPRFAYRWKYENGEYSCFSPFTEVVFEGDDFEYLSSDGYNQGMQNHIRSLILKDWSWGSEEVIELDILFKKSRSNNIYVVDTIKDRSVTSFQLTTELIGKTVESNQLLRPFDNVPRKALAQEISANRLIYANYVQNFNAPDSKITLNVNTTTHPGYILDAQGNFPNDFRRPKPSIKSIRKYQLGIVFQDIYGRQTPVFTNPSATFNLGKERADKVNSFTAKLDNIPNLDSVFTHAKYFIKDTSNEYYNLALDRFYFAEDGNVWLSFPSSERNKVDEETYLILKKQHDNDNPSEGPSRYKILDIQSQAPDFIATNKKSIAIANCTVVSGFETGFAELSFDGPAVESNPNFYNGFNGDVFITISKGGFTTNSVGVASGGPSGLSNDNYIVNLDDPLGQEAAWMGTAGLAQGEAVTINITKKIEERLPEFEGRFFVKINRDADFETNIVRAFNLLNKNYAVVGQIKYKETNTPMDIIGHGSRQGFYMRDRGQDDPCDGRHCFRLEGIGTGGNGGRRMLFSGSPQNSDPTTNMYEVYRMPKTGGDTICVAFVGEKTLKESDFREKPGYVGKPMTDITEGTLIRIIGRDDTAYEGFETKPYKVKRHYREGNWRGAQQCIPFDSCQDNPRELAGNSSIALALILEEPITEEWVGNGSVGANGTDRIGGIQVVEEIVSDDNSILTSTNPAIFETEPKEAVDIDIYYEASKAYPVSELLNQTVTLPYFNCYSFGNAVESDRIRDDFNTPKIGKGVKVSSIFEGPYAEERRSSGLIFSQIYNSQAGINRLNQFIQAEPITKDLNPEYGSIQKLHSKNTNLVTLCEDKCLSILANKDALFNADGNVNVTSNKAVLGQAVPYAGEFGISTNPESFADYGFRSYFADKNRGTVIRLSQDGITQIALKGMGDFFSDNLPVCNKIIGSYNDDKEVYNITLDNLTEEWQDKLSATPKDKTNCEVPDDVSDNIKSTTVSFKETVDGWPSRKSYYSTTGGVVYPLESGVSINDKYYTFNKGLIWEHASNSTYSNFYGTQYDCSVNVIINDVNESIKGFKTLNYSGTASRSYRYGTSTGLSNLTIAQIVDQRIAPNVINSETSTPGWYTNWINTDMEEGQIKEFVKKENKYFNKIKGLRTFYNNNCDNNIDSSAFPTQGIGSATISGGTPTKFDLIIKLDTSCSTEGNVNPNTTKKFWYLWRCTKPGSNDPGIDIRGIATDQLVKCGIEEFYNQFPNGYDQIGKEYFNYKFYSDQGVNVNTQLYNEDNTQVTSNGKFLYIDPATTPSNDALNANVTGTSVPNTYFIITITNGTISAKTQYNTLDDCSPAQPGATFRAHLGWFKVIPGQGNYFINFINATKNEATPANRPGVLKTAIIAWLNSNSIVNQNNLGTYNNDYAYLAANGVAVGQTLYSDNGSALSTNQNKGAFIYRTDQNFDGALTTNFSVNRYDIDASNKWSLLPDTYKIVVIENGVITHIVNMNTL